MADRRRAAEAATDAPVARRRPLGRALGAAGAVGLAGLSAWQATLTRQSPDGHESVLAVVAAAAVATVVVGRGRQRSASRAWLSGAGSAIAGWRSRSTAEVAGVLGWLVVAGAAIGWDLDSFAHQQHDLPTLSHYIGRVTDVPAGRGLLFAAWLALGGYLVAGWRRDAR